MKIDYKIFFFTFYLRTKIFSLYLRVVNRNVSVIATADDDVKLNLYFEIIEMKICMHNRVECYRVEWSIIDRQENRLQAIFSGELSAFLINK